MTQQGITIERVFELIEAYGAQPGAWPDDERESARAMIESQPEIFADALREATLLDDLLEREPVVEPSEALAQRILADAPHSGIVSNSWLSQLKEAIFPQGTRWPAGAALASLAMGLVGGYAYASTGAVYDEADSAYTSAFVIEQSIDWLGEESAL